MLTDALGRLVDITWVEPLMASVWVLVILFAFSAIDAFFPVVPAESLVITAGVYAAATGSPNIIVAALVAAGGAFVGDNVARIIGRGLGSAFFSEDKRKGRRRTAFLWARRVLERRGGLIIIVARYIPGGRTTVTMTAGVVGYPPARFMAFTAIAAVTWGFYTALLGYAGGMVFDEDPILGVVVGIAAALAITGIYEGVRFLYQRRKSARQVTEPKPEAESDDPGPATTMPVSELDNS